MSPHTTQKNPLSSRYSLWLIMWLGFGLRMQHLARQPLWGDEGWSFYFAAQSWWQLLALTAIDIHPPFYYLLLKGWLAISGETPGHGPLPVGHRRHALNPPELSIRQTPL